MKLVICLVLLLYMSLLVACNEKNNQSVKSSNTLPILVVQSDSINWDTKLPATITRIDLNGDSTQLNGKLKYRGGSSSKYFKHSFSLKLSDEYSVGELPEAETFILNASYIDKTFMRHRLSFDLFTQMNLDNLAPKCEYVELFMNDQYEGIYVLMQRINEQLIGIKEKGIIFKEPLIFKRGENAVPQDSNNFHQQKHPKLKDKDYNFLMDSIRDFLFNSSNELFNQKVYKILDEESIIDWQLILLLTNNSDGQVKNFYLYKEEIEKPFKVALWDYDHSWGRDGDYEYNMLDRVIDENRCILFQRLNELNTNDFRTKIRDRYFELRERNIFSKENIFKLINSYKNELISVIDENVDRWPNKSEWYHDDNNFEEEIEIIMEYTKLRLSQLDEKFGFFEN